MRVATAITTISLNATEIPKPLHRHAVFKALHCHAVAEATALLCCCQSCCTATLLAKPLHHNAMPLLKPLRCHTVKLCLFIFILALDVLSELTVASSVVNDRNAAAPHAHTATIVL